MARARTAWNESIADRVAKTSNIITQLKIIKMAGLSDPVASLIQRLREKEIKTSRTERNIRTCLSAIGKSQNLINYVGLEVLANTR
jgi:hypothetical protein